jgi:hypothetical protein
MGWTADAPVIARHEVKALREMVGSSYNGRLNLARSSSSMSNLPWSTARSCTHCPTRWPRSYRLARLAAKYGRRISASPARQDNDLVALRGASVCTGFDQKVSPSRCRQAT